MKPDTILQSDLLDIIFDGKNKAYGAYNLRKEYNQRLGKALAVTFSIVFLFAISEYIRANYFKSDILNVAGQELTDVDLESYKTPEKPKEKQPEQKMEQSKPKAAVPNTAPLIVPDDKVDKEVPEISALENRLNGKEVITGEDPGPGVQISGGEGKEAVIVTPAKDPEPEVKGPLNFAEIMPEFPGGMEGFRKFLLRNLRQPDNLEEGQKVVVRVRFVVGADGSIENMYVDESGGELDKEVLRVLGKMPHWKPGLQNGRNVAVYFSLPVTFMGPEE